MARAAHDVVIEPMTGLLEGMRSMNLGGVKRKGKHGSTNLNLNEQQILEVKLAKRQARIDAQTQRAARDQEMLHTLQQRIASTNGNGLGERESQRLRELEANFQNQMQAAAQEWRAQEEAKMEAEIERRANERLHQSLQSHQRNLQLLPT
jgi:restriction endonuclease Mrr